MAPQFRPRNSLIRPPSFSVSKNFPQRGKRAAAEIFKTKKTCLFHPHPKIIVHPSPTYILMALSFHLFRGPVVLHMASIYRKRAPQLNTFSVQAASVSPGGTSNGFKRDKRADSMGSRHGQNCSGVFALSNSKATCATLGPNILYPILKKQTSACQLDMASGEKSCKLYIVSIP